MEKIIKPALIAWRDYLELCKPKVVMLMLLTAVVGMQLASPQFVALTTLIFATLGIGLVAAGAAVINHVVDHKLDAIMARTQKRPVATGKISPQHALLFATVLTSIGTAILVVWINTLTAILTLASLIGYAVIYTLYLKRATPQNIVIGGLAGAMPPLLGWTAVSGEFAPHSLLLVLIIYTWTPPHFWALAIYRHADYAKGKIPMLPITHGIKFTKLYIFLYSILLIIASMLPFVVGMSGWLYIGGVTLLNIRLLYWAIRLLRTNAKPIVAMQLFKYSVTYLLLLFVCILFDHYLYF